MYLLVLGRRFKSIVDQCVELGNLREVSPRELPNPRLIEIEAREGLPIGHRMAERVRTDGFTCPISYIGGCGIIAVHGGLPRGIDAGQAFAIVDGDTARYYRQG